MTETNSPSLKLLEASKKISQGAEAVSVPDRPSEDPVLTHPPDIVENLQGTTPSCASISHIGFKRKLEHGTAEAPLPQAVSTPLTRCLLD